jgi:hypothetical protein
LISASSMVFGCSAAASRDRPRRCKGKLSIFH